MEKLTIPMRYTVDLDKPTRELRLDAPLVKGDKAAHVLIVTVERGGAAFMLAGVSCIGYAVLANRQTVVIQGTAAGNEARVLLPAACYSVPGRISLLVQLAVEGEQLTPLCLSGNVCAGATEAVIDPGAIVPNLGELLAMVAEVKAAIGRADTAAGGADAAAGRADAAGGAANEAAGRADAAVGRADAAVKAAVGRADAAAGRADAAAGGADAAAGRADAAVGRADAAAGRAGSVADAVAKAEELRGTVEAARVTAEKARAAAEGARETVEAARVTAEKGRVSEEAARVTAEGARQSSTAAAIRSANTATSAADAAAGRADASAGAAAAAGAAATAAAGAIDGMTVSAKDVPAGEPVSAVISDASGHKHIEFGLRQGERGAKGESGANTALAPGLFGLYVSEAGRLMLVHNDNEPVPPLGIDDRGHLVYRIS
ncbi:MAG: hypothetical protein RR757_04465 [Raoultibacter sp.]